MRFLGNMQLTIILKVNKSQVFTLSLEDTVFENHRSWGGGDQIDPPSPKAS